MTTADTLEYASLVCELGLSIVATYFVFLGRTTDKSNPGYVFALACALVLTATPVCMGLRHICAEHRHKTTRVEVEETSDDISPEVEAQHTTVAQSNPLQVQENT
jgi:hypothetical protein